MPVEYNIDRTNNTLVVVVVVVIHIVYDQNCLIEKLESTYCIECF